MMAGYSLTEEGLIMTIMYSSSYQLRRTSLTFSQSWKLIIFLHLTQVEEIYTKKIYLSTWIMERKKAKSLRLQSNKKMRKNN